VRRGWHGYDYTLHGGHAFPYVTFHRPRALTPAVLPAKWSKRMEPRVRRSEAEQNDGCVECTAHGHTGSPGSLKSPERMPKLLTPSRGPSAGAKRHVVDAALTCDYSRRVRCSPG
jgi:hypothetical protein